MKDPGQNAHNNVVYGHAAELDEPAITRQYVARSISEKDAGIEFCNVIACTKKKIPLKIARTGLSFLAKVIGWHDNFVDMVFCPETRYELPVSDIEERLRKSEKKKRQLQRRINQLLDES